MSDIIRDNKLGQVVTSVSEINPAEIDKIQDCRENCAEYFRENFDLNRKANQLLELVSDSIKENIDSNKIMAFNNDSEFHYSLSHTKQIEYYFNLARDIKKSKYYRLGYILYNPHLFIWNNKVARFVRRKIKTAFYK